MITPVKVAATLSALIAGAAITTSQMRTVGTPLSSPGTASAGSSQSVAKLDHVHGNAMSATAPLLLSDGGSVAVSLSSSAPLSVVGSALTLTPCAAGTGEEYRITDAGVWACVQNASLTPPRWDDLRVPLTTAKAAGVKDPAFSAFRADGGSTGTFAWHFSGSTENELFFSAQLPHGYKLGTNLHPHIHWVGTTANTDAGSVRFGIECSTSEIGGTYLSTRFFVATAPTHAVAYRSNLTELDEIPGFTTVSAVLVCRIFRDPTNAADNYPATIAMTDFDFHFEQDTVGSADELSK
jgi:hypothetical protein